jgi:polyphosphate kinase 2 (PPK2 family)
MLSGTSTGHAPWFVVPSNRKWFRNLLVSEAFCEHMNGLELGWPEPSEDLSKVELE